MLLAALEPSRPRAARWLAQHPESFTVVGWTHLFYGTYRDIGLDLPGIERLLAQREPTEQDRRELASWSFRFTRAARIVGDALPLLGRWLAQPAVRLQMREADSYLRDHDGIGTAIRLLVRNEIQAGWAAGASVLLIGHSLGSVICYDTLWDLSHDGGTDRIDLFITMGSPLATRFFRHRLRGAGARGAEAFPRNIRRWVNLSAHGDTTALQPRLKPSFQEMLDLGLLESFEDFVALENFFRGPTGLNAHEAYGYFAQRTLAEVVGDWVERL